jgi:hypothetical protein
MFKEKTSTTNIKEDVVVNMDLVVTTTNKLLESLAPFKDKEP